MRRRISNAPADSHVEQMRNFAEVIRGEAAPVVSGKDGAQALVATRAIKPLAQLGRLVRIDDMLKRR